MKNHRYRIKKGGNMDKRILVVAILLVLVIGLAVPLAVSGKPTRAKKACNDGSDNDGDGYIDMNDPGCANPGDTSELDPSVECDDGMDNDGDDDIDYNDGGCSGPTDDDETNCGDGVCEGGETAGSCPADCGGEPDSCNDTDGGNVITVFGTTSGYLDGSPYSNDDYCVDVSNIMEYYCSGDYEQSQQQSCGTDGYVGDNYCLNGSVYRDYRDYSCSSGECGYTDTPILQEECDYGCTNGECDPMPDSCDETDSGYDPLNFGVTYGYLSGMPYAYNDTCNTTTFLVEWYCIGDHAYSGFTDCATNSTTTCSNGACV